ncbi:MAG: squalene/phytoene synthase family protein [Anaerolineae bacterium]|nr:squalene/phytoene synthase family protein [Anaerolineae bacterium]
MTNQAVVSGRLNAPWTQHEYNANNTVVGDKTQFDHDLAARITKAASRQTYYTIHYLVDRERVADAYRAYGYFRWVDDYLDQQASQRALSLAFVERQQMLIEACYRGEQPRDLAPEEQLLADLIASDSEADSGLQAYIRNLMAVMAFDAERKGRLIDEAELAEYSRLLATAVTEAMHYYIGHDAPSPHDEARYLAVTGAHITHMLRDTFEDVEAGYYNIPREFLDAHGIDAADVTSEAYREWVKSRVELARDYFRAGRACLAQVKSVRCRVAAYAYMARFESVLAAIEREDYRLREDYQDCKSLKTCLRMVWNIVSGSASYMVAGRLGRA